MTEKTIQFDLFWSTKPYVAAPNIYMYGTYESDLLVVTKAMIAHEFEIKISKSDFFADFKKSRDYFVGAEDVVLENGRKKRQLKYETRTKHQLYLNGKGPNRFSYVFPEGMIDYSEVPEWCGIVVIREQHGRTKAVVVRSARMLHKNKFTDKQMLQLTRSLSFRAFK